jgi:hypothetical protein
VVGTAVPKPQSSGIWFPWVIPLLTPQLSALDIATSELSEGLGGQWPLLGLDKQGLLWDSVGLCTHGHMDAIMHVLHPRELPQFPQRPGQGTVLFNSESKTHTLIRG